MGNCNYMQYKLPPGNGRYLVVGVALTGSRAVTNEYYIRCEYELVLDYLKYKLVVSCSCVVGRRRWVVVRGARSTPRRPPPPVQLTAFTTNYFKTFYSLTVHPSWKLTRLGQFSLYDISKFNQNIISYTHHTASSRNQILWLTWY